MKSDPVAPDVSLPYHPLKGWEGCVATSAPHLAPSLWTYPAPDCFNLTPVASLLCCSLYNWNVCFTWEETAFNFTPAYPLSQSIPSKEGCCFPSSHTIKSKSTTSVQSGTCPSWPFAWVNPGLPLSSDICAPQWNALASLYVPKIFRDPGWMEE